MRSYWRRFAAVLVMKSLLGTRVKTSNHNQVKHIRYCIRLGCLGCSPNGIDTLQSVGGACEICLVILLHVWVYSTSCDARCTQVQFHQLRIIIKKCCKNIKIIRSETILTFSSLWILFFYLINGIPWIFIHSCVACAIKFRNMCVQSINIPGCGIIILNHVNIRRKLSVYRRCLTPILFCAMFSESNQFDYTYAVVWCLLLLTNVAHYYWFSIVLFVDFLVSIYA